MSEKESSQLRVNLIANYLGQGWGALMSLAFVPLYLRFIGAEGYGLVGFFTMLSASLIILDAGLGSAAMRESAAYLGAKLGRRRDIALLLRTIEVLFWVLSLIVGLVIVLASPFIVQNWLNVPSQSIADITSAVRWMGVSVAVQFSLSFYGGCLNGLQRQVSLNAINAIGATVRGAGAVLILWFVSPTVQAFFAWQAIGGLGILLAQRVLFMHSLQETRINSFFSLKSIKRVREFVVGIGVINILGFLLTQLDKIILSKVLSLEAFGYYSLAWTLGAVVYRVTGPIFNAYYPRITQLLERRETDAMLATYQQATKIMAVVVVPLSLWLALFSKDILQLWTRDAKVANASAGALSIIALGTMCNAFMHMPYALQLAHSFTRLALIQNVSSVIILAPLTWFLATEFGLTAAAVPWLLVNFCYVLIGAPLMHYFLVLPGLKEWYLKSVFIPVVFVGLGLILVSSIWSAAFESPGNLLILSVFLAIGLLLAIVNSGFFKMLRVFPWKNTQ